MRQPYQLSIALRYLRARSRNGFISMISLLSMLGIALAVAVLIVVLSVMNGFETEIQQRALAMVSDATLTRREGALEDWRAAREQALAHGEVRAAAPFVEGQGVAVAGDALAGIAVRGVDPELERGVSRVAERVVQGSLGALEAGGHGIVVGVALAEELSVGLGDAVTLLLPEGRVTPIGIVPRLRRFEVVGIFDAGMLEYDRGWAFVHLDDAARLFGTGGEASGLRLGVTEPYAAGRIVMELANALIAERGGSFYVSDWTRENQVIVRSIELTKTILFVVLSLVVAVAAFNIISTLVMVVREKRGDIAILRSLGTSPRSIVGVFTSQGTAIGIVGTIAGIGLGLLVAGQLANIVSFIEAVSGADLLAAEVYPIDGLPTEARAGQVVRIAALAFGLAVLATIYPALSAARQPPAEALRHE